MALKNSFTMQVLALCAGAALLTGGGLLTIGAKTIKGGADSSENTEFKSLEDLAFLEDASSFTVSSRITVVNNKEIDGKKDNFRVSTNTTIYYAEDEVYGIYDLTMRSVDEETKTKTKHTASILLREYVSATHTYLYIDRFSYTWQGKSYIADRVTGQWIDFGTENSAQLITHDFIDAYSYDEGFISIIFDTVDTLADEFNEENDLYTLRDGSQRYVQERIMSACSAGTPTDKASASFEADLYSKTSPKFYLEVKDKGNNTNFSAKADVAFTNVGNTKITVPKNLNTVDGEEFVNVFESILDQMREDE